MDTLLLVGGGVVAAAGMAVAVAFGVKRSGDPLRIAVESAIETQTIDPIVTFFNDNALTERPMVWHKVFDKLWSAYERKLVAQLLLKAAEIHDSDTIKHWTERLVEVEPDLAMKVLRREFIIEKLELPEDAIPKPGPRRPKAGERQYSKKKGRAKRKR